jgi:hypothetical protein
MPEGLLPEWLVRGTDFDDGSGEGPVSDRLIE